jgi:hypothetical protein
MHLEEALRSHNPAVLRQTLNIPDVTREVLMWLAKYSPG